MTWSRQRGASEGEITGPCGEGGGESSTACIPQRLVRAAAAAVAPTVETQRQQTADHILVLHQGEN